ncbi:hypothetical protein LNAOJCKE_4539 [Methylorubrum aminovorans]|uniref:Phage tail assembly chaperone-like domain-containing protein n=1 Tax=Methylorubrum aminovorans TaxID=269069 RepID=A0ABQ4UJW7_9HYPH|nr:phage tail assembly chaperone [Methylorubrum aminovorans]GJE67308.1 hypothetical protein LNAOJCKE_4539 [Methylorubrum aminovorans]GMA74359.1 hypothetical protein GCM10025880_07760 [Methylorubrum aminovorans]
MDLLLIEGGIVVAILHDAVSTDDRRARLADLVAEARSLETQGVAAIEPTSEDLRDATRGLTRGKPPMKPKRLAGLHLSGLRTAIAALEAAIAEREGQTLRPAEIYVESVVGQPLVWPRAHRAALLASTDHTDLPGWRADKAPERLEAADAYRAALRALPEAHPDPAAIDWPERPAGL